MAELLSTWDVHSMEEAGLAAVDFTLEYMNGIMERAHPLCKPFVDSRRVTLFVRIPVGEATGITTGDSTWSLCGRTEGSGYIQSNKSSKCSVGAGQNQGCASWNRVSGVVKEGLIWWPQDSSCCLQIHEL